MGEVQQVHPGSGQLTEDNARLAVRRYSETYFLREISNGLSRVLPGASADKVGFFLEALSALSSREFSYTTLERDLDGLIGKSELRTLLRQLFNIGGVGTRVKSGPTTHTNFYFRRAAGGGFRPNANYVLHNSLVVAWNLNW